MSSLPNQLANVTSKTLGATVEVIVKGEIDIGSVELVAAPLRRAVELQRSRLVVDLEQVEFLEIVFVHLLAQISEQAEAAGMEFVVIPPPERRARQLMDIAGMNYLPGKRNRLGGVDQLGPPVSDHGNGPSIDQVIQKDDPR